MIFPGVFPPLCWGHLINPNHISTRAAPRRADKSRPAAPGPGSSSSLHLEGYKPSRRLFGNMAKLILSVSYLPVEKLLCLSKAGFASLPRLCSPSHPSPSLHPAISCRDVIRCFGTKTLDAQTFFLLYCCIHKTGWENC